MVKVANKNYFKLFYLKSQREKRSMDSIFIRASLVTDDTDFTYTYFNRFNEMFADQNCLEIFLNVHHVIRNRLTIGKRY